MPADRAVIVGTPAASVTSVSASEYATPNERDPNWRMKSSAIRRASPVSISTRAITIAVSTIHTDGSEYPPRTSRIGVPLMAIAVRPRITTAALGSGFSICPAITARKIANRRHPCGVIDSGGGIR